MSINSPRATQAQTAKAAAEALPEDIDFSKWNLGTGKITDKRVKLEGLLR